MGRATTAMILFVEKVVRCRAESALEIAEATPSSRSKVPVVVPMPGPWRLSLRASACERYCEAVALVGTRIKAVCIDRQTPNHFCKLFGSLRLSQCKRFSPRPQSLCVCN